MAKIQSSAKVNKSYVPGGRIKIELFLRRTLRRSVFHAAFLRVPQCLFAVYRLKTLWHRRQTVSITLANSIVPDAKSKGLYADFMVKDRK
jgi:hypothetical protein